MDRAAYKSIAAQIKALPRDRYRELADELGRGDADAAERLRVELLRGLRAASPPAEGVSPAELEGRLLVDEDDLWEELERLEILDEQQIHAILDRVVAVLPPATGDGAAARTPELTEGAVLVDAELLRAHVARSIRWNPADGDKSTDELMAIFASKVDDEIEALRFQEPSDE